MTHNSDTPSQWSDLIRSVDARITTHQHERQALVAQLQAIRRTAERLLVALVARPEARAAGAGRGPRTPSLRAGMVRGLTERGDERELFRAGR